MNPHVRIRRFLTPFISQVGLAIPVEFELARQTAIFSDLTAGYHVIYLAEHDFQACLDGNFAPDVAHELIHALISERVSMLFCQVPLDPEYVDSETDQVKRQFLLKKDLFYHLVFEPCSDMWANSVRHSFWPEITFSDLTHNAQQLHLLFANQPRLFLQDDMLAAFALIRAEQLKFSFESTELDQIYIHYPRKRRRQLDILVRFLGNLPELAFDPVADVSLIEPTFQELSRLLRLPIKPQLISIESSFFWRF